MKSVYEFSLFKNKCLRKYNDNKCRKRYMVKMEDIFYKYHS